MILRRVRLLRWRRFVEPLDLRDLGGGLTILHGPNGAGKSTLAEALRFAFFVPSTSGNRNVQAIVPADVGIDSMIVGPQVTVWFQHAGREYRLRKRYLKRAETELADVSGSSPRVVADGAEAEAWLRRVWQSERPSKAGMRPAQHGLARILWTLEQGDLAMSLTGGPLDRPVLERLRTAITDHSVAGLGAVEAAVLAEAERELREDGEPRANGIAAQTAQAAAVAAAALQAAPPPIFAGEPEPELPDPSSPPVLRAIPLSPDADDDEEDDYDEDPGGMFGEDAREIRHPVENYKAAWEWVWEERSDESLQALLAATEAYVAYRLQSHQEPPAATLDGGGLGHGDPGDSSGDDVGLLFDDDDESDAGDRPTYAQLQEAAQQTETAAEDAMRRAIGLRRLRLALLEARAAFADDGRKPVEAALRAALQQVGLALDIQLDDALAPDAVGTQRTRGFASLSLGEQEAVWLLLRLELARRLAAGSVDGPLPIVIDDALTAIDDARLPLILQALQATAETVPVLLLTCHPQRYAALGDAAARIPIAAGTTDPPPDRDGD